MSPDPVALLAVAAVGGVLALDRVAFLQCLVSRPLPTSAIVGLILGQPALGLACGLYMELIWLSRQPVGGFVPPDETLAALAAVCAAAAAPAHWATPAKASAGVLIGLPYGLLGRRLDLLARKANAGLMEKVREGLMEQDLSAPGRAQVRGAAHFALAGLAGSVLAVLTAGPLAGLLLAGNPRGTLGAMEVMSVLLPVIGAGSLLASMPGRKPKALFVVGVAGAYLAAKAGLNQAFGFFSGKRAV